jgi:hypothetical protein
MSLTFTSLRITVFAALAIGLELHPLPHAAKAQQTARVALTPKPETVEWVYRVRYGSQEEWFKIFTKYQLVILEKQKQLGYVTDYTVWAPSLHTSEESRWDYRIVITRASHDAPASASEGEVARQLFPDQDAYRHDENRRWELTTNHWDLPIHSVDIHSDK